MLIGQVINMARFWTVKKNAQKPKNELNVSQKSFLPSFWWDRSSAWRRFGSKSQLSQHFLHRCKFSSLFTFVIKTPLYRYVKHQGISIYIMSTQYYPARPRARSESARAVTGRRCPHSGKGEDFLTGQSNFFTETAVTPEQEVEKLFPRWEINRHVKG